MESNATQNKKPDELAVALVETAVGDEVIDEIIEIEIFVKEGRDVPLAKGYVIRVDKEKITVHQHEITGRRILELAHKVPPENYILRQIFRGGRSEKVELNQTVDLHRHKVEKFKTLPRDQTEG